MIAVLVASAFAQEPEAAAPDAAPSPVEAPAALVPAVVQELASSDFVGEGWRIAPMGAPNGLRLGQEAVVGRAGGTNATTITARGTVGKAYLQVGVPFAAFRTPEQRTADLGNVGIDVWFGSQRARGWRAFGVEATVPTGGHAWTWTNRPEDLWPNAGVDAAWQGSRDLGGGGVRMLHRTALGVHFSQGYEPFPVVWVRAQGAVALDASLGDRFGVTGEASLQTWDTSPLELSGLFRANVIEGLDTRAGLVLPVGVWAGWTPADQRAGLSEATFLLDVTMAL